VNGGKLQKKIYSKDSKKRLGRESGNNLRNNRRGGRNKPLLWFIPQGGGANQKALHKTRSRRKGKGGDSGAQVGKTGGLGNKK